MKNAKEKMMSDFLLAKSDGRQSLSDFDPCIERIQSYIWKDNFLIC